MQPLYVATQAKRSAQPRETVRALGLSPASMLATRPSLCWIQNPPPPCSNRRRAFLRLREATAPRWDCLRPHSRLCGSLKEVWHRATSKHRCRMRRRQLTSRRALPMSSWPRHPPMMARVTRRPRPRCSAHQRRRALVKLEISSRPEADPAESPVPAASGAPPEGAQATSPARTAAVSTGVGGKQYAAAAGPSTLVDTPGKRKVSLPSSLRPAWMRHLEPANY